MSYLRRFKRRRLGDVLTTGREILSKAGLSGSDIESQILLSSVTGFEKAKILAEPDYLLSHIVFEHYIQVLRMRSNGYPLQYITGVQEFRSLKFDVNPSVMIPRPETELLVKEVLERGSEEFKAADIGTGSGCIAVSLAVAREKAKIVAADISEKALETARKNALSHNVDDRIDFRTGDMLDSLTNSTPDFDFIVSNPPYISENDRDTLDKDVRDYEPDLALFSGTSGMQAVEELIEKSPAYLKRTGYLIIELSHDQSQTVKEFVDGDTWKFIKIVEDHRGIQRILILQKR